MPTCTQCGGEIEPLSKYLAGDVIEAGKEMLTVVPIVFHEGQRYQFWWACEHHPAPAASIRLASKACVEEFCAKHPECISTVIALMSFYEDECKHKQVN